MTDDDGEDPYEEYAPRIRADRRGTRPRTKTRPQHLEAVPGFVIAVDRGRYRSVVDEGLETERLVTCSRARELRKQAIVTIHERATVLRRSADDSDTVERIIVANADQLLMVVAAASPEPRLRLIDRYIVAALDAGLTPLLCITKTDLAPADGLRDYANTLGIAVVERSPSNPARDAIVELLQGHVSVAVGHSGVGKSTLVNEIVPDAHRAVGDVNEVTGRGRHTSSSSSALKIPEGGWIIDTPGVRSFGLGHVSSASVIKGFPELLPLVENCPRACSHTADTPGCEIEKALASGDLSGIDAARAQSLQMLMETLRDAAEHRNY